MSETVDCRACGGTGKLPKPCGLCQGNGYVTKIVVTGTAAFPGEGAGQWIERCPNGCIGPTLRNGSRVDVLAEF